jgi:transposase
LHRKQRDKRLAYRINATILFGTGWSVADVAQALLIDEDTVRNWLEKYRHGGEEELLAMHYQGKAPSLTCEQQDELAKHLDENTYLDSKAIRHSVGFVAEWRRVEVERRAQNFWPRAKTFPDARRSTAMSCARYSLKISSNTKQTEPDFQT